MAKHHKFSRSSKGILKNCEPVLTDFASRTLFYSPEDLSILKSSVRTAQEQREFIDLGVSFSEDSSHLPNENGLSEALDIGIYIKGVNVWKLQSIFHKYELVHDAAQKAAREMQLEIRSGVCWNNLNSTIDFNDLLWQYRKRKYAKNEIPFFDGPHFELIT